MNSINVFIEFINESVNAFKFFAAEHFNLTLNGFAELSSMEMLEHKALAVSVGINNDFGGNENE